MGHYTPLYFCYFYVSDVLPGKCVKLKSSRIHKLIILNNKFIFKFKSNLIGLFTILYICSEQIATKFYFSTFAVEEVITVNKMVLRKSRLDILVSLSYKYTTLFVFLKTP